MGDDDDPRIVLYAGCAVFLTLAGGALILGVMAWAEGLIP